MADRDSTVEVAIVGKADPSLQAATASASAQVEGLNTNLKLSNAEGRALLAALGTNFDSISPKALAAAAAVGALPPALTEVAGSATEVAESVGAVSFSSLQQGVDASLGLDRSLISAANSAKVFSSALSSNAGFDAAKRDLKSIQTEIDALTAKEMLAAKNATLGQAIANSYAGVTAEFKSAAASAAIFEAALAPQATQAALAVELRNAFADEAMAAAAVGEALAEYGVLSAAAEGTTRAMHGSVSTATREFRALFDELSSGRTRQTPGTLAIIATQVFGLGPAALAALAGVAALTGGLAYYIYRVHEAAEANTELEASARNAGNFDIQKQKIEEYVATLSRFPTVTKDAAREIIGAYADMRGQSEPQMRALMALTAQWAFQTKQEAPDAAKALAAAFSAEELSGKELTKLFPQITQAQIDGILQSQRMGDTHQRNAEMLKVLNQEVSTSIEGFHEHNASMFASASTTLRYATNTATAAGVQRMHNRIIEEQTEDWKNDEFAVRGYILALENLGQSTNEIIEKATKAADAEDTFGVRIRQTKADIDILQQGLEAAKQAGDQVKVDQLEAGLKAAQENLTKLQTGQSNKDMFGLKMAGEEAIMSARETVSEINAIEGLGAQERLQKIQVVWNDLLRGESLTAKQRAQVNIEMNRAIAAENKEVGDQLNAVREEMTNTDLRLSRMSIEAKKKDLETDFANHAVTAAQKAALLQQYVMDEYSADMDVLQSKFVAAGEDVVLKEKILGQIKTLEKQNQIDLATIRRQETSDYQKELNTQVQAKQSQVRGLLSAEDQFVRSIFTSQQGLTMSLLQLSGRLLQEEIANDLKYFTQKMFYTQAEMAASRSMEQGGLLAHLLTQRGMTAATVQGNAARNAANATSHAGFLADIGETLMRWLGLETAKTTAVVAGDTTRAASTAVTTATGQALMVAAGAGQIGVDAAVAAAGAYAATAAIPYVGPVIAPAAAATAYAAVMAMQAGLVVGAAEGGAWEVNGGLWKLHEQESVIPAHIANPMREFFEGGNSGAKRGGDTHIHLNNNATSLAPKSAVRMMNDRTLMRKNARTLARYMAGNPGARPAY